MRFRAIAKRLLATLIAAICSGCVTQPPSLYMPLDPVFKKELSQSGMIPILVFPDDPIEAVYDRSEAIPGIQPRDAVDLLFSAGIKAVNDSIAEERKKAAYQTALPVIEQLSAFNLTSDMESALASEMKNVRGFTLTTPVAISQKTFRERAAQTRATFDNDAAFLASLMPAGRSERFYLTLTFAQTVQTDYTLRLRYQLFSKDNGVLIFRNHVTFICPGGGSEENWANWWAADRGRWIRAAYTKGVRTAAAVVASDLGARNPPNDRINITRTEAGLFVARCADEWWK